MKQLLQFDLFPTAPNGQQAASFISSLVAMGLVGRSRQFRRDQQVDYAVSAAETWCGSRKASDNDGQRRSEHHVRARTLHRRVLCRNLHILARFIAGTMNCFGARDRHRAQFPQPSIRCLRLKGVGTASYESSERGGEKFSIINFQFLINLQ